MKKLGKLKLRPEKMLNHDELVSFRGGSSTTCDMCYQGVYYDCQQFYNPDTPYLDYIDCLGEGYNGCDEFAC